MVSAIGTILGGLGLFLLGMALMTDGLKAIAGARLRDHLVALTRRPRDAILTGAAITALVQSSSATTLATIGFVSAGLIPFQTSVGVIVGANIGTTSTGWLVALLGLKFSIAKLAMPLVGIGALLRLLGRDRLAFAGSALAGFGMIFIGIDFLQAGMQGLSALTDPSRYAFDGFGGRLLLVGFGVLMTVIMQSSSAAVATTLTALSSGALTLDQAAALVVGQNVGTTVTAILGAIGAGVAARRTAAVHVLFNLITAGVAILLLPLFTGLVAKAVGQFAADDPAIVIAAFHTAFNLLGALLFLPLSGRIAHLVQLHIRERTSHLASRLNVTVRDVPALASVSAAEALRDCLAHLMWQTSSRLGGQPPAPRERLAEVADALPQIRQFLAQIPAQSSNQEARSRQMDLLRCIDHLSEVLDWLQQPDEFASLTHPGFRTMCGEVQSQLDAIRGELHENVMVRPGRLKALKKASAGYRYDYAEDAAGEAPSLQTLTRLLEAQHAIEQTLYHFWRCLRHLKPPASTDERAAKAA